MEFKRGKLLWSVVSKEGGYCGVGFQKREVTVEWSFNRGKLGGLGFQKRKVTVEWSFKRGKLRWSVVVSKGGKLLWTGVSKEKSYCGVKFQKREVTVEWSFKRREVTVEWSSFKWRRVIKLSLL